MRGPRVLADIATEALAPAALPGQKPRMTKLGFTLAAILYCALVVLALRPAFDLDVARAFYEGSGRFVGQTPFLTGVRYTAWALPFATLVAMLVVGLLGRLRIVPPRLAPSGRSLLMLVLALAIGPGLVVHATLKEVSHRPRPTSVTLFGGPDAFEPFYDFDGACRHNCSFPSGETAAATWMMAPASLVPPPFTAPALGAAVVFAAGTGLLRMAFGGHFLSDVCGGALISLLTILALRSFVRRRAP